MMGGRGYGNHGNYSGSHVDRSERRGNSGGGGGVSNGSVGGGGGGGGVREEREGRKSGGGEREQYGGGSSGGGGGGGRRGKDEEGKKNSVPPRMSRKARENESSRSQVYTVVQGLSFLLLALSVLKCTSLAFSLFYVLFCCYVHEMYIMYIHSCTW